jgi:hypothetical protein
MRMRPAGAVAALTLFAAALAACDSGPADATATPDPCALLTPAEIQQALGEPFERSTMPEPSNSYQRCTYDNADHLREVFVDIFPGGRAYDALKTAAEDIGVDPVDVPGVGDGAFRTRNARMVIKFRGYALDVVAVGFGGGDPLVATDAANAAVEQLGRAAAARV